ncbi:MAG: FAD-dependent oxidoreductase, partial [Erysipelotrichaceae bacterium]|nr:FAD-dependent oxidoreductase [Erysipelotrichaceae bacterium]
KPHTADLAGEGVELKMERGFVVTDSHMRTSLDGVYAIGDITGHQQLAHVAEYQGMIAVENILGNDMEACYENVPSCIYTSPEIACVGKNLRQLEGQDIITGRFNTGANGRAILSGAGNGTVRIYADKESHRLLGAQIMAPAATDMITEITALLNKNGTLEDIADTIHPHPTFAEIIKEAAADALHQ